MAKKPSTPGETKTYLATRTINHDGEIYEQDEEIALGAGQAQQLLDVGAIAEKPPSPGKNTGAEKAS